MSDGKCYIAIDLKSFFASVECVERGLDPLITNLLVADSSRTSKTICLAVTPALKSYGISGRARLFEAIEKVKEANIQRLRSAPGNKFTGSSWDKTQLDADPSLSIDFITAPPRMSHYMDFSSRIYKIYMKYAAPEDIHVYSIDEVFIDATAYLKTRGISARAFTQMIIQDVYENTGITATAGIGSNLYLCKIAMDIVAKKVAPDPFGVRIAQLDEMSYRRQLWDHRPLTDFWRVGRGYAKKLEAHGLYTMGDIARCSLGGPDDFHNEDLLYKLFGINAQLLIDHAWGWESCTIADIKAYKPENSSMCSGQVLHTPYTFEKTRLIVREMIDLMVLDLVDKGLATDQIVLTIGYDIENLSDPNRRKAYKGEICTDFYGRKIPKHAHGTVNLGRHTSSMKLIMEAVMELFDRICDPSLLSRRVTISANHILDERSLPPPPDFEQLDMFTDYENRDALRHQEEESLAREKRRQQAVLNIRKKFGKNAILRGTNFEEGATTIDRNKQIGGHKA